MQTLTKEQFEKKYGTDAVSQFGGTDTSVLPEKKSFFVRAKEAVTNAGNKVNEAITGMGDFSGKSSLSRGISAAAEASNVPLRVGYESLPETARTALSSVGDVVQKGFSTVTDKIAETPLFKELGKLEAEGYLTKENAPEYFNLKESLGGASDLGQISGNILAADQVASIGNKAFSAAKSPFTAKISPEVAQKVNQLLEPGGNTVNHIRMNDKYIASGDFAPDVVYKDVTNRIYTEKFAKSLIDDTAESFKEAGAPKLAEELSKYPFDLTNTTPEKVLSVSKELVKKAANSPIVNASEGAVSGVKGLKDSIPGAAPLDEATKLQMAIKDATPNYELASKAERMKLLPRVKEGGVIKGGGTIVPDKLNIEAGKELLSVPGYDVGATKLVKYQTVKKEIARQAESLKTSLANEKVIIPKKELASIVKNAIDTVSEESLLLQKTDPAIQNYLRVLNNSLAKVDGTLGGELELRKVLDASYENARGKNAFGSDKVAALDEVHTAARNALTEDLIARAKNVDVKTALRKQWNLYRALDELQVAAEREARTTIGRLMQKYPITTKAIEKGAKAVGLGTGIELVK